MSRETVDNAIGGYEEWEYGFVDGYYVKRLRSWPEGDWVSASPDYESLGVMDTGSWGQHVQALDQASIDEAIARNEALNDLYESDATVSVGGEKVTIASGNRKACALAPVTIETISGKQYTVVWHGKAEAHSEWIQMASGLAMVTRTVASPYVGYDHIATALPALPRYPKPEQARLLYRYMAEGIEIGGDYTDMEGKRRSTDNLGNMLEWEYCEAPEIRYGLVNECERVDVAIEGDV